MGYERFANWFGVCGLAVALTAASGKGRDGGADRRGKNGKPGWPCSRAFPALILQHALK
jgi:hypothetical protein